MKALARHIALNVRRISLIQCSACDFDCLSQPTQKIHHCQLPSGILMCMHFDEAVQDINETVVLKDWLIVLVGAGVKLADLSADQVSAVKNWLHDTDSEEWEKCVKNLTMAVFDSDL